MKVWHVAPRHNRERVLADGGFEIPANRFHREGGFRIGGSGLPTLARIMHEAQPGSGVGTESGYESMKVGRDPAGGLGLAKGLRSSDDLGSDCRIAETVVP